MGRRVPDNQPSSSSSNQQNNAAHVPPDGNSPSETITFRIDLTKNLIERCLRLYMTKNEVKDTLFKVAKVETALTECVWEKLEEENPEFFKAYYAGLKLIGQVNTFNSLRLEQYLMSDTCPSGLQVQLSPAALPTGNPVIQQLRIPFPSADHGNLLGLKMNSGNEMGRSENVASKSTSNQQNNAAPGANSHSETIDFTKNLIEKCLRLYMTKNEVKDALFNVAKIETVFTEFVWQKLEAENPEFFKAYNLRLIVKDQINAFNDLLLQQYQMTKMFPSGQQVQQSPAGLPTGSPSIQQPPIPVPSADHGNFRNEMVGNENGASKSPSDMLRLSDSANKSHFERNPQPLSLGLDGEPKSSNGVLASDPTADRSNLPATGSPAIQQPPIPSPSAGRGSSPGLQVNSETEVVASCAQVPNSSSEMSWTFDSEFKSHFKKPHPTADLSNLPVNQSDSEEKKDE